MNPEPQPVHVDPSVLREIARHAEAVYPEEACGVLLGPDARAVRRMLPLERRGAPLSAALQSEADTMGLKRVGSWHSHPEGLALPREIDRRAGRDGNLMLIVAVNGVTGAGEIAAWRVEAPERFFLEIPIEDGRSLVTALAP